MNNGYKIIIISGIISIFILSAVLGYMIIGKNEEYIVKTEFTPTPVPTKVPEADEPVSEVFRIKLSGTTLELFEGDEIIRSTMISPELYPFIDIESLQSGSVYETYEEALMDWESLSE